MPNIPILHKSIESPNASMLPILNVLHTLGKLICKLCVCKVNHVLPKFVPALPLNIKWFLPRCVCVVRVCVLACVWCVCV